MTRAEWNVAEDIRSKIKTIKMTLAEMAEYNIQMTGSAEDDGEYGMLFGRARGMQKAEEMLSNLMSSIDDEYLSAGWEDEK